MGLGAVKTTTKSEKIENFQATVCEFGLGVPLLYGRCRTSVDLINYQDFTSSERKQTSKTGKSKNTSITYYYNCYLELAIGETISSVGRIWVGDKKYDSLAALNGNAVIGDGSHKNTGEDINEGSPLQVNIGNNNSPTTYMSTKHPDIAVGYEGLSYLYGFIYLGEDSASVPSYKVEVNGLLQNDVSAGDGTDANPAHIIRDIMERVGLTELKAGSYTNIDAESFNNYANYCKAADLLVSTPDGKFNSQTKAQEIIAELLNLTNTYMYWNNDRFVFVPRDDRQHESWMPNKQIVYDLTADDLALDNGGLVNFKRKDSRELYNHITVNFTNRDNDYEQESISYQDVDNIRNNGIKSVSVDALWLHTKERAVKYAKALARKYLTEQNQYTLKLDWKYGRLTPGDLVRVTDNNLGIINQVMMVSEITEDAKGLLTITAIQREDGDYSEATYTVNNNYSYQDFNIVPGDTARPLFIIPPADLITSANGLEMWIALHGEDEKWGGCNIFLSDKDSQYTLNGVQDVSSTYGTITSAMTEDSTSVNVRFSNPKGVELLTGSVYDAEQGNTLIWVNGECMSYTLATLTAKNTYTLSGLIRGQYGTKKVAHNVGEDIAVLDSNIYVVPLTKHYQGRELYFKFPSFNVFGGNGQNIAGLDYYNVTANTADLPNCTDVTAYTKYREMADDITRYDVVIEWEPPDFASYQQALVWFKTSNTQGNTLGVIPEGVAGNELGFTNKWAFGGQGYNSVTIPQAAIGDTYRIAVCTQDIYGNTESPDMSEQIDFVVARKSETPNTPSNVSISFGAGVNISWEAVRNADIKRYEIRDNIIGENNYSSVPALFSTTETECTIQLTERRGTLYVYAVSAYEVYSAPAIISYNKPVPITPSIANVTAQIQGLSIVMQAIPTDAFKINLKVNDDVRETDTSVYHYDAPAGVYSVSYCFVDCFGAGEYSVPAIATVEAYIPPELLAAESFNYERMSQAAKNAIADASTDNINVAVKGILGNGTSLVLQEDGYALVTINGDKITGLFADEAGTLRLQGDYIHLTGNTVFDENVIIKGIMTAGSISCDNGVSIAAGAVGINGDGMQVQCTNGSMVAFNGNGMQFVDSNGRIFSNIGRYQAGTCRHNQVVSLNWDVAPKTVLMIPSNLKTYATGYDNVYVKCFAENVTAAGFTCKCYTTAVGGSSTSITTASATNSITPSTENRNPQTLNTIVSTYNMPSGATRTNISIDLSAEGFCDISDRNGNQLVWIYMQGLFLDVYVNGTLTKTVTVIEGGKSYDNDKYSATATATIDHASGATIGVRARLTYVPYTVTSYSSTIKVSRAAGTLTPNVTGDTTIATGEATFFAFG